MTKLRYRVGWGGSPPDTWATYDDLDDALSACRALAETEEDVDIDDLEEWGDGPATGWGVCPEGDTGGYGACVVAQYWTGRSWQDYPADGIID